ncbi:MAG TPA: hypothetical protein H9866_02290 [Candidatus Tidjanibacter gallistercoris]|nr:hypothetical protein [Candidatus Tidjanibacter gallistercoris]
MKLRTIVAVAVAAVLVFGIGFLVGRCTSHPQQLVTLHRDTVTVMDTIVREIPVPHVVTRVRVDTCYLPGMVDTVRVPVAVPIERKEYRTPEYCAVVEGYRPELVEMEVYRQTQTIREVTARHDSRFSFGIQAGVGITHNRQNRSLYRDRRTICPF